MILLYLKIGCKGIDTKRIHLVVRYMKNRVLLVFIFALLVFTLVQVHGQIIDQYKVEFGCLAHRRGEMLWNATIGSDMQPEYSAPIRGWLQFSGVAKEATVRGRGYLSQSIEGRGCLMAVWAGADQSLNWIRISIRPKQGTIGIFVDPDGFILGSGDWSGGTGENLLFKGYLNGKRIGGECIVIAFPVGENPPPGFEAAVVQLFPEQGAPIIFGWFNMPMPLPDGGSTPTGEINYWVKIMSAG